MIKRFKIATLVISLVFCLLTWILYITQSKYVAILIPLGIGSATVYFSLIKYWIDEDAIFKSLFQTFNERFDKLNENLNEIVEGNAITGSMTKKQIMQDYLNLCSEEYFWFRKDRIPKFVWEAWNEGIKYYLSCDEIANYFKSQQKYDRSYYGFLKAIENFSTN